MFGVGKCRPTLNPTPENLVRLPEGHKYGDRLFVQLKANEQLSVVLFDGLPLVPVANKLEPTTIKRYEKLPIHNNIYF